MKKNLPKNNSRLYVTEDIHHENVWFARTEVEMFARFKMGNKWEVYLYPYKYTVRFATLKACIEFVDRMFKEYFCETYKRF